MRHWGRWRDREFTEHYWLAYDLEEAGTVPAVLVEMLGRAEAGASTRRPRNGPPSMTMWRWVM
jgi:hypothetical protein